MKDVLNNFVYNFGYQILTILIPIITTPYLARIIGVEGVGQYSYANSIAYYFMIFIMLGLNNYGNRTIASVRNNSEKLSASFCEIYLMQLILGIIVSGAYIIFCFFSQNVNMLQWIMLIYVFSAVLDVNWFFFGLEQFKFLVIRNMVIKLLITISIFVFVKDKSDLYLYVCIILLGNLVSNIILWPRVFKMIKIKKFRFKDALKHFKPNLILFIPIIAVSLYKYMDKIMLGKMSVMEQVGFYEYSEKITQIPMALVNSLGTVMLPKMSNLVANNLNDKEEKYISTSILIVIFCSSSVCFGLMGIAKEFVPFFYGNGYQPCVNLFYILLPSCCFIAFANVIRTQYLIPHKLDVIYIKSVILGALINFILNIILIIRLQAIGAAIATLITEIVVCIYQAIKVNKILNIMKYARNILPFIFSGICMFIFIISIPLNFDNLIINMIIKVIIGVLIYFLVLMFVLLIKKNTFKRLCELLNEIK